MTVLIIDKLNLLSFSIQVLSDHHPVREIIITSIRNYYHHKLLTPASDELIHAIFKYHFWTVFGIKAFLLNQAQWPLLDSSTWNFIRNLLMYITCLCVAVLKSFIRKTLKKSKNHEYSRMWIGIKIISKKKKSKNPWNSALSNTALLLSENRFKRVTS